MRKFILLLLSILSVSYGAFAQELSNGYYRVTNADSDRYIHVLDNKGSLNVQTSSADMGAIILKKGIERAISDPASVLYLEKHGSQYDIQAQNTGIYSMIGVYVNLIKSPTVPNAYCAYGKKGNIIMYLWDASSNMNKPESYLETSGSSKDWYIKPIDNSTENYFGVQPTHSAGGKHYASFYAAFPFSLASPGMKAYYITTVNEKDGVAVYKEITGTIPALTPVIIECSSENPADNKINIGGSGSAPSGNLGKGVIFELHKHKHDNYVTYNKSTMRTIGVAADGSIAMTAGDYQDVPKNTFYISVSSSCPASLRLVNEDDYQSGPVEATGITLNQTSLALTVGSSATLTATVTPDKTTDKTVTWSSSNTAVATVDASGKVSALSAGSATITAKCGSVSAQCEVTVSNVQATGITLSETNVTLTIGSWTKLTATVLPENTTDKTVTWTSSNPNVATVDQWGTIRAIAIGSTTVTATCGSVSATCSVTVPNIEATSITLDQTSVSLTPGDWIKLTATVLPENATDKTVTWTSSNPDVATVDQWGTIRAVALGTTTVTATCGNVSATCAVTVASVEASSITLSQTNVTLTIGDATQLKATVLPENATDKTVTWTSSNPDVATVDQWGTIRAVALGTTTVTATCGNVSATCAVTVAPVEASSITLNRTNVTLILGESTQLTATVIPDNTTDKTVTWTSSNPDVATVDQSGTIRAVAAGYTAVTATCGNVSATCGVTVIIEASSITLSETEATLPVGDWKQLSATVAPDNATDKTIIWSSSNHYIVDVDQSGNIFAVSAGHAIVTATCGKVSASCDVTVYNVEATAVTLSSTQLDLTPGESVTLTASVDPENTTDKTVIWSSSDNSVVTVDSEGKVTAITPGTASITASCGNATASCAVTVHTVEAASIQLSATSVQVNIGQQARLEAKVLPENTTDKTVIWSSSDPQVATVDDNGLVTGVAEGSAEITATCGSAIASCTVKVTPLKAESIILSNTSLTMHAGDSETLVATILPEEVADKSLTWTSSDPTVAEISSTGVVTAIAPGTAVITAEVDGIVAECTVTVLPIEAESITLDATTIEITVPDTYQLTATIEPGNTTDKTLTWVSSDASVATVDADGLVTAVSEGNAVITVTCGNVQAECTVKVNPLNGIHDITIDGDAFDVYTLGGIKVRSNVTSLDGLAPGFYIVNGHTIRH